MSCNWHIAISSRFPFYTCETLLYFQAPYSNTTTKQCARKMEVRLYTYEGQFDWVERVLAYMFVLFDGQISSASSILYLRTSQNPGERGDILVCKRISWNNWELKPWTLHYIAARAPSLGGRTCNQASFDGGGFRCVQLIQWVENYKWDESSGSQDWGESAGSRENPSERRVSCNRENISAHVCRTFLTVSVSPLVPDQFWDLEIGYLLLDPKQMSHSTVQNCVLNSFPVVFRGLKNRVRYLRGLVTALFVKRNAPGSTSTYVGLHRVDALTLSPFENFARENKPNDNPSFTIFVSPSWHRDPYTLALLLNFQFGICCLPRAPTKAHSNPEIRHRSPTRGASEVTGVGTSHEVRFHHHQESNPGQDTWPIQWVR